MISIFVEWNNKILIFANCVSTCKVVFHLMPLELNFSLLVRTECPLPRLSEWGATLWKVPSASNLPLLRRKFVVKFLPQSCQVRKFFLPLLITLERDLYREHTSASPCSTLLIKKRNSPSILVAGRLSGDVVMTVYPADVVMCQNLLIPSALQVYPISIIIPPIEPQIRKKHNCSPDWYKIDYRDV